ncbi:efflux RND transporter periplasmic adaptor subunit [Salinicola aestuarinus]|uniref:efflux RND transporter periplasmic adaptor subunit n=1 Tax=Salinicola aestuarinus TaxID=1949082 RepID=UPI000DA18159|nr:efflux RND transporter periplasmic adaptor subunit [Salinicola aestuarinus]
MNSRIIQGTHRVAPPPRKSHRLARRLPGSLSVTPWLLATLLLGGCHAQSEPAEAAAPLPPEVDVVTLQAEPVTLHETFTGRVVAPETVELRPRVSGYVDEIAFEEGQRVEAGDLLFRIDPRPYDARVAASRAALDQARSQRDLANAEAERSRQLVGKQMISREQHDQRQAAALDARARVAEAEATLSSARLDLEYTRVTAPVTARTGRAMVTRGNLASADQTVLTMLVSVDPLYVYFDSNETLANGSGPRASQNAPIPVQIGLAGETGFPHRGELDFIDNRINPNTGSLQYRAVLDNPEGRIRPGQFARVDMPTASLDSALLIDRKAILANQDRRFVYVVADDNTVMPRQIVTGRTVDKRVVIREGLAPGDRIVVNGTQKIFAAGMPITPHSVERHPEASGSELATH